MAKTDAKAAATTKDRSSFKTVVLDSYLWRGASAKSPLIGRVIGTEKMVTKFKSQKNPEGVVPVVIIRATEPSSWLDESGNLIEAPVDADVRVVITAGLEQFGRKALLALASNKAPEVVLQPSGQSRQTPNGAMKLYSLAMEPQEDWPALREYASDLAALTDEQFEVGQLAVTEVKQLQA